jgi:hypothetical protein
VAVGDAIDPVGDENPLLRGLNQYIAEQQQRNSAGNLVANQPNEYASGRRERRAAREAATLARMNAEGMEAEDMASQQQRHRQQQQRSNEAATVISRRFRGQLGRGRVAAIRTQTADEQRRRDEDAAVAAEYRLMASGPSAQAPAVNEAAAEYRLMGSGPSAQAPAVDDVAVQRQLDANARETARRIARAQQAERVGRRYGELTEAKQSRDRDQMTMQSENMGMQAEDMAAGEQRRTELRQRDKDERQRDKDAAAEAKAKRRSERQTKREEAARKAEEEQAEQERLEREQARADRAERQRVSELAQAQKKEDARLEANKKQRERRAKKKEDNLRTYGLLEAKVVTETPPLATPSPMALTSPPPMSPSPMAPPKTNKRPTGNTPSAQAGREVAAATGISRNITGRPPRAPGDGAGAIDEFGNEARPPRDSSSLGQSRPPVPGFGRLPSPALTPLPTPALDTPVPETPPLGTPYTGNEDPLFK